MRTTAKTSLAALDGKIIHAVCFFSFFSLSVKRRKKVGEGVRRKTNAYLRANPGLFWVH